MRVTPRSLLAGTGRPERVFARGAERGVANLGAATREYFLPCKANSAREKENSHAVAVEAARSSQRGGVRMG